MQRVLHAVLLGLATLTLPAQAQTGRVQSIGDVTFAVPDGWAYQAAADFGAMAYKDGNSWWFFAVYASMPSSGDPVADFKAAWKRIVLSTGKYKDYPGWGSYSTTRCPRRRAIQEGSTAMTASIRPHTPGSTCSRLARATSLCLASAEAGR